MRTAPQFQVPRVVVSPISVYVVDRLTSQKLATHDLFHHQTVFENSPAFAGRRVLGIVKRHVTVFINHPAALPCDRLLATHGHSFAADITRQAATRFCLTARNRTTTNDYTFSASAHAMPHLLAMCVYLARLDYPQSSNGLTSMVFRSNTVRTLHDGQERTRSKSEIQAIKFGCGGEGKRNAHGANHEHNLQSFTHDCKL